MPDQKGFSLVETMVALLVLLAVTLGVLPLTLIATKTTENQGHLTARTTEYAQDKLEQLLALAYGDVTSDTRVFPTADGGSNGLTPGGSTDPNAPVNGYVDYLDINGTLVAPGIDGAPADWYYRRVWAISVPREKLKQVTVTAIVRRASTGGVGRIPSATVMALKSFPF